VAGCFWLGRGDRNAGWADRSSGAEFRLPLLIGVFGFAALQAVILNKAMSLIVVLTALPARSFAIPFLEVIAHWTCGKAGVPTADVRGNITSHRA